MIRKTVEGYEYVSDLGIIYHLLEGVTIGGDKQYTSDIIFIMLMDADYNVDNNVVGYLFGASILEENPSEYEESIRSMTYDFEVRNKFR